MWSICDNQFVCFEVISCGVIVQNVEKEKACKKVLEIVVAKRYIDERIK